ncbi:glucoamylase [Planctomycetaceae bacterium SCGC AG-212-D15]|nr:glucoamylase [Planctomycetaceae bacterium SCGC AG-212-D15]
MPSRIEDYALIGDCETAGLVGKDGSLDWLCAPRFDSAACFAALLGTPDHGRWLLAPKPPIRKVRRQYRDSTLILETEFETESGVIAVIDAMPRPRCEQPAVIRIVEGRAGQVPVRSELIIRFDYGAIVPWVRRLDGNILQAIAGPDALLFHPGAETHGEDHKTASDFTVAAGQRVPFVLQWYPSYQKAPPPLDPEAVLRQSEEWWRQWSAKCRYEGPYRDAVLRSLITLKALIYEPTGGIVAAPTTSLPEQPGGVRNWDYRYCWLRDATFTLYSLVRGGYTEEAAAWREWLLRAIAGSPSEVNIMYGLGGERRLTESQLDWLHGYEGAKPVRVGNAAWNQLQLDVFGEVMNTAHLARQAGLETDEFGWRLQINMLEFLEKIWEQPDEGIWEIRGPRRHFTHSKVMAWLAFDRVIQSAEQFGLDGPIARWKQVRAAIHDQVCREGYDAARNTFVEYYGSDYLDASLLMIPMVGFLPAADPRVQGTIAAIEKGLLKDGFVQRYATREGLDGLPPGEGAFLPCTFWLADNYALQGRHEEARVLFERLLGLCNDVGLLSEEYHVEAGRLVGNFPQAFSHIALINSACALSPKALGASEHRRQRPEDAGRSAE